MQINNNDKIEKCLDELASEYKELLIARMIELSGSYEYLSISELLRIDESIKRELLPEYRRQQRKKRIVLTGGILYSVMGIMLLLLSEMTDSLHYDGMTLMALVITFVGMLMSLIALLFTNLQYSRKRFINVNSIEYKRILEYKVITTWRELEGLAIDIYVEDADKKQMPVISIISRFLQDGFINKQESIVLRDFLKIRNDIVHATNRNYNLKQIQMILRDVEEIISKIKKNVL